MRKVSLVFLMFFLFMCCLKTNSVKAESIANPNKNLISLNNLLIYEYKFEHDDCITHMIVSKNPIFLEKDQHYTLVLDRYFFSNRSWDDDRSYYSSIFLRFYNWGEPEKDEILEEEFDRSNPDYVYISFIAYKPVMEILRIPIGENEEKPRSFKIMLYEGTIADFQDYSNYKSEFEPKKGIYFVNYENPPDLNEILASITIFDDIDGDITGDYKIIVDEYTNNLDGRGTYLVKIMAIDSSDNKAFYELNIKVMDTTPPVITGQNHYDVSIGENTISVAEIKSSLIINDNCDVLDERNITIDYDGYTENEEIVGDYEVRFKGTDESGNFTLFTVSIFVRDNIPPVIEGPSEHYRYTVDPHTTMDEIRNYFTAYDYVDGDLTKDITYDGMYRNTPGTYEIILSVKDKSDNIATKKLYIHVIDGIPPNFETNELILSYEEYENMTEEEIINWLEDKIPGATNVTILLDESTYSDSKNKKMYVYYSYQKDGTLNYGRIIVEPSKKENLIPYFVGGVLVLISGVFLVFYFKRSKIHL